MSVRQVNEAPRRMPVVIDTVAAVSAILPERVAAPLQNGAAWAIRHPGDHPPGAQELIASHVVGNMDQASIFLGAVGLIRAQMDRETDQRIAQSQRAKAPRRPDPALGRGR